MFGSVWHPSGSVERNQVDVCVMLCMFLKDRKERTQYCQARS